MRNICCHTRLLAAGKYRPGHTSRVLSLHRVLIAGILVALMPLTAAEETALPALAPCPDRPNCVSSQALNQRQHTAPFGFHDTPAQAMQRLRNAVLTEPRITLVSEEGGYLHAEARSLVFRFVDDLEFLLAPAEHLIHVRSAARTGYSDFGVNRKRIERIRRAFNAAASPGR